MSLTLPACRQPSCCDEWAGYGVTLLPKSSTGDVHRVNSYRTLPRAGDHSTTGDGTSSAGGETGAPGADVAKARYYGGTSNNAVSWCGRFGVPVASTLAGCSCRLGSTSDQTASDDVVTSSPESPRTFDFVETRDWPIHQQP